MWDHKSEFKRPGVLYLKHKNILICIVNILLISAINQSSGNTNIVFKHKIQF